MIGHNLWVARNSATLLSSPDHTVLSSSYLAQQERAPWTAKRFQHINFKKKKTEKKTQKALKLGPWPLLGIGLLHFNGDLSPQNTDPRSAQNN